VKMSSLLRPAVLGVGAFAGGTIAIAQLGSAITGYGAAHRESVSMRNELAQSVQTAATDLSYALRITSKASLRAPDRHRCATNSLPASLVPKRDEVCVDAALES